ARDPLGRAADPSRPVVGNAGWESVAAAIVGVHDYESDPTAIDARYQAPEIRASLKQLRFGGRIMVVQEHRGQQPVVLTEFGGVALSDDPQSWGYARSSSARQLERRLVPLFATVRQQELFAGYC